MRLALSFDDGPSDWTGAVLDALALAGARASFFVLGEWIDARPDAGTLLRRMVDAGHDVGNHTWSHPHLVRLDDAAIEAELTRTSSAIERVAGVAPTLFRAPRFEANGRVATVAERLGLAAVGSDVDPSDWRPGVDAATIAARVLEAVHDGAIVDLHDGVPPRPRTSRLDCRPTVDALDLLLPALVERGFELVAVSELLALNAEIR